MRALFVAEEEAWGGMLGRLRKRLPEVDFVANGSFEVPSLAGYDVVIPTMARIDAALLETADRLRLIQQVGAGLEGVDRAAAEARGIAVHNVPTAESGNADSVAELGIWMMVGLARDVRRIRGALAERHLGTPIGLGLKGRTVGLVGMGGLGQALAKRLRTFDMTLLGLKRTPSESFRVEHGLDWLGGMEDLPELLGRSDFVLLTLPDNPQTHHLIDKDALATMRRGSFLINLGRGGLVEHGALLDALDSGQLGGAGLDVFWQEPPDPNDPIFRQNVIATPHIAGITDVSLDGIIETAAARIEDLARAAS